MDLNVQAFRLVQALVSEETPADKAKKAAARKGGKRGGVSRSLTLTDERKREIATIASKARWSKNPSIAA